MGCTKNMMMDAGERNCILADRDEVARWAMITGTRLFCIPMKLDAGIGRGELAADVLGCSDARRLAHDERLPAADREDILWRLEVGGLPTDPPADPNVYTLADRLGDLRYMVAYVWPARLWAAGVVTAAATAATVARRLGLRSVAIKAAWYAYDVADHDPADDTWETIRRFAPWAWTADDHFRPDETVACDGCGGGFAPAGIWTSLHGERYCDECR